MKAEGFWTSGVRAFFDVCVTHVNCWSIQSKHTAMIFRARKREEEEIEPDSDRCRDRYFYTTGVWYKRVHET